MAKVQYTPRMLVEEVQTVRRYNEIMTAILRTINNKPDVLNKLLQTLNIDDIVSDSVTCSELAQTIEYARLKILDSLSELNHLYANGSVQDPAESNAGDRNA